MGFLSSLLGTKAEYKNTGATADNLQAANQGVLDAGKQQAALNSAYNAQNGLGKQGDAYNNLTNISQGQQGLSGIQAALGGSQLGLLGQQQGLNNQLQDIAAGRGPNPAQAQLAQATGANTSNQAALMAGQRGAGSNAGLIARQAAQQGAANQQNSAGQAATLQANQSLGALGQVGGNLSAMNQTYAGAGNQLASAASTLAGAGATGANAGNLANTQVAQQQAGQNASNALAAQNQGVQAGLASSGDQIQAQLASGNSANNASITGGVLGGAGALLGAAKGGLIGFADGGGVGLGVIPQSNLSGNIFGVDTSGGMGAQANPMGPKSSFGQFLGGFGKGVADGGKQHATKIEVKPLEKFAQGGPVVPAMVSAKEKILPPQEVGKVVRGEKPAIDAGYTVKGKEVIKGPRNTEKNDIIPKNLAVGSIVLPKSVTESSNPHWAAHKFVSAIMREKGISVRKPKV